MPAGLYTLKYTYPKGVFWHNILKFKALADWDRISQPNPGIVTGMVWEIAILTVFDVIRGAVWSFGGGLMITVAGWALTLFILGFQAGVIETLN